MKTWQIAPNAYHYTKVYCSFCKKQIQIAIQTEEKLEIDHIVPISEGGKTVKSNSLCFKCNRGKGKDNEN